MTEDYSQSEILQNQQDKLDEMDCRKKTKKLANELACKHCIKFCTINKKIIARLRV